MKKYLTLLFIITLCLCFLGCGKQDEDNEENEIQKINLEITDFIKSNMDSSWSYSEEKFKIDNSHNIEIVYNNVDDWSYCAYLTNKAVVNLNKNNTTILQAIPKISFFCKNDNHLTSRTEYENISSITKKNVEKNAKYYDANDKQVNQPAKEGFKKTCSSYKYKDIFRNPEKYLSKRAIIKGEVIQVLEETNAGVDYWALRVNMTKDEYGFYEDTILVVLEKNAIDGRIIEDDIYTFYGLLSEPVTYETVLGARQTIPSMLAFYGDLNN